MNDIKILHFSDLHFSNSQKNDIDIIFDAFIEDLEEIASIDEMSPDIVIFSGDLVQAGDDKESFDIAYNEFLLRVIKVLNLTKDRLFLVPGNHDIQKNAIAEYIEVGLRETLNNETNVNKFIDELEQNQMCFQLFTNYFGLLQNNLNNHLISSNILYSTHELHLKGLKIGIACLNSSWRATGKSDNFDHGKLLLGERQIDLSIKDIQSANLKIAVIHHPMEWINPFEANTIKRRLYHEFDMILFGHNHDLNPELIDSSNSTVLISNSGSIYQTRKYYNGYSIIKYNNQTNKGVVYLRSYFDKRRKFDKAIDHVDGGSIEFQLQKKKGSTLIPYVDKSNFERVIIRDANDSLLTSSLATNAPRNILDLFVTPPLSNKSERTKQREIVNEKDSEKNIFEFEDLIQTKDNFLLVGCKESGKTTLLKYLCIKAIGQEEEGHKIPFYINYQEVPAGKPIDAFQKAMLLYAYNQDFKIDLDIKQLLTEGKCLLLIDDFDFRKLSKIKRIKSFIAQFPLNKYIFSLKEDHDFSFDGEESYDIGISYKKIYLREFNRHRIRLLVENWFKNSSENIDKILDKITQNLKTLHVPSYPVVISVMLGILENTHSFYPHNKASLLEKFIEILLEKYSLQKTSSFHLDYTDRENYVTFLVEKMVDSNQYYFTNRLALEKLTLVYFKNRGLTISISHFVDYFFQRGLFFEFQNSTIQFKYRCFCEYFIAKQMMMKDNFYSKIINGNNQLQFINELDIYTGLKRNDQDLVAKVENQVRILFENPIFNFSLNTFNDIDCKDSIFDKECTSDLIQLSDDMDDEKRDDLIDGKALLGNNVEIRSESMNQKITKESHDEKNGVPIELRALENLILFSKVVRNSELIENLEYRQDVFDRCICYWAKFLLYMNDHLSKKILPAVQEKGKEEIEKYRKLIKISVPIVVQSLIAENLGSEKMDNLIKKGFAKQEEKVLSILYVFLYCDLFLPNYLFEIKKIMKNTNKFVLELINLKLHSIYLLNKLSPKHKSIVLDLIVEISAMNSPKKVTGAVKNFGKNATKIAIAEELEKKAKKISDH